MKKILQGNYLVIIFYFFVALIPFGKLPFTFFLQDEWAIFGNYLYWEKADLSWWDRLFVYEQATHLIPLSTLTSYLSYKLFGLSFFQYGFLSIFLHLLNSFFVFYFTKLFFSKRISFVAGLLFLTSSISHQAITWTATTIGTAGSTLFVLLTLIYFAKYIHSKKSNVAFLFISFICLSISVFFKETSIFIFLFLPIFWCVLKGKIKIMSFLKGLIPFFILGVFYLFLRLFFILFVKTTIATPEAITQPSVIVYCYRLFTVPLKFIGQSIIPVDYIISISSSLLALGYPNLNVGSSPNPYIVESVGADMVTFILAIIVLLISFSIYYISKKRKRDVFEKFMFISLLFIALSSLPFIIIPGKAGFFSLIDGRHLYLTSIFTSILLSLIFYSIYKELEKRSIIGVILIGFLCIYIFLHAIKIRTTINPQMGNGYSREKILHQISTKYPVLPKKVLFYIESDKAYYGLPVEEKILPFQSGFGQVLLVWYNAHGQDMPACMFKDQYLYVLLSEGYKDCQGQGFGYFRDIEKLKTVMKFNKLDEKTVIAFSYTSSRDLLEDITQKVRRNLSQ